MQCNSCIKKTFVRTFHGMLAYLLKPLDSVRNIGNNPYFFAGFWRINLVMYVVVL